MTTCARRTVQGEVHQGLGPRQDEFQTGHGVGGIGLTDAARTSVPYSGRELFGHDYPSLPIPDSLPARPMIEDIERCWYAAVLAAKTADSGPATSRPEIEAERLASFLRQLFPLDIHASYCGALADLHVALRSAAGAGQVQPGRDLVLLDLLHACRLLLTAMHGVSSLPNAQNDERLRSSIEAAYVAWIEPAEARRAARQFLDSLFLARSVDVAHREAGRGRENGEEVTTILELRARGASSSAHHDAFSRSERAPSTDPSVQPRSVRGVSLDELRPKVVSLVREYVEANWKPVVDVWLRAKDRVSAKSEEAWLPASPLAIDLSHGIEVVQEAYPGIVLSSDSTVEESSGYRSLERRERVFVDWFGPNTGILIDAREIEGGFRPTALFGSSDVTGRSPPDGRPDNGFTDLRRLDHDSDGVVGPTDPGYHHLRIWRDLSACGSPKHGTLMSLPQAGIEFVRVMDWEETGDPTARQIGSYRSHRASELEEELIVAWERLREAIPDLPAWSSISQDRTALASSIQTLDPEGAPPPPLHRPLELMRHIDSKPALGALTPDDRSVIGIELGTARKLAHYSYLTRIGSSDDLRSAFMHRDKGEGKFDDRPLPPEVVKGVRHCLQSGMRLNDALVLYAAAKEQGVVHTGWSVPGYTKAPRTQLYVENWAALEALIPPDRGGQRLLLRLKMAYAGSHRNASG